MKIALLHVKSWQAAYKHIIPEKKLGNLSVHKKVKSWYKRLNRSDTGFPKTLIAEYGDEIFGFCSFGVSRDAPNTGSIFAIYFCQKYWGMGYSQKLIYTVLQRIEIIRFQICYAMGYRR
ncbi:GNAT family N-acetyltransferase [Xenorhabdus thailandensis]|uniref:GNAT family N-acetyltransferase n=1 Tax=Xenorhabdus thailandensis TaxID=3136255 RepID=UPI0030F3CF9B